jgi:hypothetical protein
MITTAGRKYFCALGISEHIADFAALTQTAVFISVQEKYKRYENPSIRVNLSPNVITLIAEA